MNVEERAIVQKTIYLEDKDIKLIEDVSDLLLSLREEIQNEEEEADARDILLDPNPEFKYEIRDRECDGNIENHILNAIADIQTITKQILKSKNYKTL